MAVTELIIYRKMPLKRSKMMKRRGVRERKSHGNGSSFRTFCLTENVRITIGRKTKKTALDCKLADLGRSPVAIIR